MTIYTVKPGDFLLKIARQHGFRDFRTIYDDAANAAFRQKRPNPDVIFAGDELVIPDNKPRVEEGATGQRHTFFVKRPQNTRIRVVLKDHSGVPLAGKRYELRMGGVVLVAAGAKRTGPDGLVEHDLDPLVSAVELTLFLDETSSDGISWQLDIGALDPVSEIAGVQHRLNNLDFDVGQPNGQLDHATLREIHAFRRRMKIRVSRGQENTLDDVTRASIESEHGS
ncbi:MAG: LysM domain-containing protein [Byssovorax sp.]